MTGYQPEKNDIFLLIYTHMLKDFINKANSIHKNFYDYSLVEYKNNKTKVKVKCPTHGEFEQRPNSHLNGQGCPKCYLENKRTYLQKNYSDLIDDFKKSHSDFYNYSSVNYINTNTKVKIECPIHGIFEQTPKNHINGHGCPKCALELKSKILSKNVKDVENDFNKVHNNKYDYSLMSYKNSKNKIVVICPEHGEFKIAPTHHLNGGGCTKCSKTYKPTTSEFVERITKVHNNKYNYSGVNYVNNYTKIKINCPEHGTFFQQPLHHLNGVGCPTCNESKGERKIRIFLEKENIKFIPQKRFNKCKDNRCLPFDFYLPNKNMCVEFDGEQHYIPKKSWGGIVGLEKRKNNDNIKTNFCKKNKINLIRISYNEINEIENILKNELLTK